MVELKPQANAVTLSQMALIAKYPNLMAAIERSEDELREDLQRATAIIQANPNSDEAARASTVQGWIGQALRLRTPGLNGPLAWEGRSLVVQVPSLP